jgi:large subunit ribosomal protein L32e
MAKLPSPLVKKSIIKKRRAIFERFQSHRVKRVDASWRKPKGIDCRVRRRYKGAAPMPVIGYGSNKKTKFLLPNGFYKFLVNNVQELDLLLMHNRKYCAEIAHGVSTRNRVAIVQRAAELGIRVTNKNARLQSEEKE